jgi:hypothetical protein
LCFIQPICLLTKPSNVLSAMMEDVVSMEASDEEDMDMNEQEALSDGLSIGDSEDGQVENWGPEDRTEPLEMQLSSEDEMIQDHMDEESLESNESIDEEQLPMFPLTKPTHTTPLMIQVDIDSISMIAGDLSKLVKVVNKERKSVFQFCANVNQFSDCTTKSRFLVASDKYYKPTVVNKKRKLFGLQLTKNLRIAKVKVDNIEMVLSLHLLEENFVGNPYFTNFLKAAICLAMNTALMNPEWLQTGQNDMNENELQEYNRDLKNLERFTQFHNGARSYTTVGGESGEKFLSLFQKALLFYSTRDLDTFEQGDFVNRNIHWACYHGLQKYPEAKLVCIKKLLDACKHIVTHGIWTCVAAGTKSQIKGDKCEFQFGQKEGIQQHVFRETKALQQRVVDMLGVFTFAEDLQGPEYCWNGVVFQHDVGIEVAPVNPRENFLPHGPVALDNIQKSIHVCTKERMIQINQTLNPADELNFNEQPLQENEEGDEDVLEEAVDEEEMAEFLEYLGIPDYRNDDIQDLDDQEESAPDEENEFDQDVEARVDEAISRAGNHPAKYMSYPLHLTLGLVANCHKMDLQLKVSTRTCVGEDGIEYQRKGVEVKHSERAVHGEQIYKPESRSVPSHRSQSKLHCDLKGFGALVMKLLVPSPHLSQQEYQKDVANFKHLTQKCKELWEGDVAFTSGSRSGGGVVRIEYCFASNGILHPHDFPICPLDHQSGIWPLEAIVIAQADDVQRDLLNIYEYALKPILALSQMDKDEMMQLTPPTKTAMVHMAEIVQQQTNSTCEPGNRGTHRYLVKMGLVDDYDRVTVPTNLLTHLDRETQFMTKLKFGLSTKMLPLSPKFDDDLKPMPGEDKGPAFFYQQMQELAKGLQNPYKYIQARKRLLMLTCQLCLEVQPNHIGDMPGVMDQINYGRWIDCSLAVRAKAVETMGEEVANLYIDERNYLLRKRLDRMKKTQQHGNLLKHLVKKKNEHDFEVITSGDIGRITSKFPNQNVLFCDDTQDAKVTRIGMSMNILMCLYQKTQGELLVFFSPFFLLLGICMAEY